MNQSRKQLTSIGPLTSKSEARMQLLERGVLVSMPRITQAMVQRMELPAVKFVIVATRMGVQCVIVAILVHSTTSH